MIDLRYYTERFYPVVGALIASMLFLIYRDNFTNVDQLMGKLVESALVVSGTLLGFLLTITTIINSIDTRRMRFLKQQGGYKLIMKYLKVAIVSNIITVSMTIVIPFVYSFNHISIKPMFIDGFQVLLIAFSWIASIRFSVLFIKLLTDE